MDNLSQLHCVFDILSGALYTLTFEAHRLLPAWLLSARESCWRNVDEFARNMPRGQWRHSAGRRDFNDSAKNWIPGSENHNSSRSATSHNPTCAWSNRWTETTARVVFFIVTADIRRGTSTFVVRSGLANIWPPRAPTGRFYGSRHRLPCSRPGGGITDMECCQGNSAGR